jgi:hypothetical protein
LFSKEEHKQTLLVFNIDGVDLIKPQLEFASSNRIDTEIWVHRTEVERRNIIIHFKEDHVLIYRCAR